MPRYDRAYEALAERAVESALVDIQAFIRQAVNSGMSVEAAGEQLMADFETSGPIFGKFTRGLQGAGESSVSSAYRQGVTAGEILADPVIRHQILTENAALAEFLSVGSLTDVIDNADPEQLSNLEDAGENIEKTWVAELRKTCYRCLPLHGLTRTESQWRAMGLHPDVIHQGWQSSCHCVLVPAHLQTGRADLTAPLVRSKPATESKGSRKTVRALTSADIARATQAVNEALDSDEGKKLLQQLGSINARKK